ncbi:hypothetical protein MMC24_006362 [Lignoscripta atroalba]|nr:hypothetical protein [Lignoscripta atroalba]
MSSQQQQPCGVHIVGSVPLPSSEHVFRQVCKNLPGRLRRLPDGETGTRQQFTGFQGAVFAPTPAVLRSPDGSARSREEVNIQLLPTGYDDFALASYATFCQLRTEGVIPQGTRFQVSLPTPINTVAVFVDPSYQEVVEPVYEKALLSALRRIQDEIPAKDLAIQWDVAVEFGMLENVGFVFVPWWSPVKEGVVERIVRVSAAVDEGVEMGYHLCYGDIEHRHFVEPKDMGLLVEMANLIVEQVEHRVSWFHMPVPKDRADAAYFAPLKGLRRPDTTELYLGVVQFEDEEGTRRRIQAAKEVVKEFGVATECGMGRTPPEQLAGILEISAAVSAPRSP